MGTSPNWAQPRRSSYRTTVTKTTSAMPRCGCQQSPIRLCISCGWDIMIDAKTCGVVIGDLLSSAGGPKAGAVAADI